MSALDVLLAVDAVCTGQAQRRATVRHRHIGPSPMVVVAYRMSGEAGAPLGVRFGTSEGRATTLVAPEPRSRAIRFREVLNPLAERLVDWLGHHMHLTPVEAGSDKVLCNQAPQILVPNRATAELVGAVLGRSLRYLRSTDEFPVPDATVLLGTHMTWFDLQAQVPGSSVLVAATDLLRRHWATGQSAVEDEDLHVLLNWIDPPDGLTGAEAAAASEERRIGGNLPAAGPTPDPAWDRDVLEKAVERFNRNRGRDDSAEAVQTHGAEVVEAVTAALIPGWEATWAAHRLLASMRPGGSVVDRWDADRWAWTAHVLRVREGVAFFRTRDTAKQAAFALANFEEAQEALDVGEVVDDPLVLAGLVADGEALLGEVTAVDPGNTDPGKGARRRYRPLLHLSLGDPGVLPVGAKLAWVDNPKVAVEVVAVEGAAVTLKVFGGMGTLKQPSQLPGVGDQAVFAAVLRTSPPRPRAPQEIPWTHLGADTPSTASEVPQ